MGLALSSAIVLSAGAGGAQSLPTGGIYAIASGNYHECCGFAGIEFNYDLPVPKQTFVRFTVDPQGMTATLTLLADDMRAVFSTVPCSSVGPIDFAFGYGLVSTDYTFFHVDPGPPPYQTFWNYTVSNSANQLRLDGTLGTAASPCADVPTRFGHSNVVAILVLGPRLSVLESSMDRGARIMLQGTAGWTNVIEASTDLVSWTPVSTNVMDYSLCPICPYAIFEDTASTNLARRFYRAFEFP
jgi:hypothetical protein